MDNNGVEAVNGVIAKLYEWITWVGWIKNEINGVNEEHEMIRPKKFNECSEWSDLH